MRHLVREAKLEGQIEVASAGTAGYHTGDPPDRRASAAGRRRGVLVDGRARQFQRADWQRFDYVFALDRSNYDDLCATLPNPETRGKLALLRSFDPASPAGASVPDPYYGGDEGFDEVLELCFAACRPLLEKLRRDHGL